MTSKSFLRGSSRADSPKENNNLLSDKFDPDKILERSQSDVSMVSKSAHGQKTSVSYQMSSSSVSGSRVQRDRSGKVSESAKVYFDLSRDDSFELEQSNSAINYKERRLSKENSLETITQGESVSISRHSSGQSIRSSQSVDSLASLSSEGTCCGEVEEEPIAICKKYPLSMPISLSSDAVKSSQNMINLKASYNRFTQEMEDSIKHLKHHKGKEGIDDIKNLRQTVVEAWHMPVYGRDLAYGLCDVIRNEGVLDIILDNCKVTDSGHTDLLEASASLLEQCLSVENRKYVEEHCLESVVGMTYQQKNNHKMANTNTGILEGLFKISEEASTKIISQGGLDVILHWSKCSDINVLRHCARAMSNLSLFGGSENQEEMARRNVPEWLFPLAFMEDDTVRYYACLAISVLVANKELEAAVIKSGSLDLVMPFINSTKPSTFAKSDISHQQGRDNIWLERLVPLLFSRREEAQSLAAFHFAMEAGIKEEQGRIQTFYDINAVEPLKKVASSPNATASKLAAQALKIIGESIPHKLTPQVPVWGIADVKHWVTQVGFPEYVQSFETCQVDGDLLLQMTVEDLEDSIGIKCRVSRKRFMRELKSLKITADYSSCDPTQMDGWLMKIVPDLSQYTYHMLKNGMNKDLLATTNNEELESVCGIRNSVHRRLILEHIEDLYSQITLPKYGSIGSLTRQKSIDPTSFSSFPKAVDVFISYRRSNGSQLASLLKVHLQLRGFSVFLDIDRLRAGKFDENLLMNIKMARHFLLVLTPNALDRCFGDHEQQDWIHKEVVTALDSDCNIIPVLDSFEWPSPDELPEDMQQVVYFNGVSSTKDMQNCYTVGEANRRLKQYMPDSVCKKKSAEKIDAILHSGKNVVKWVHDYQDACVDKVQKFMSGENTPTRLEKSSSRSTPENTIARTSPERSGLGAKRGSRDMLAEGALVRSTPHTPPVTRAPRDVLPDHPSPERHLMNGSRNTWEQRHESDL